MLLPKAYSQAFPARAGGFFGASCIASPSFQGSQDAPKSSTHIPNYILGLSTLLVVTRSHSVSI